MKVSYRRHARTPDGAAAWVERFVEPEPCEVPREEWPGLPADVSMAVVGKTDVLGLAAQTFRSLSSLPRVGGKLVTFSDDLSFVEDQAGIVLAARPGTLVPKQALWSIMEVFTGRPELAALGFVSTKELPPFGGWPAAADALWQLNGGPNLSNTNLPPVSALAFRAEAFNRLVPREDWMYWDGDPDVLAWLASDLASKGAFVVVDRAVLVHDAAPGHSRACDISGHLGSFAAGREEGAPVWLQEEQRTAVAKLAGRKDSRPEVVFVFREVEVCGLVLLAYHVCNGLCERGVNARVACTRLDPGQARLLPTRFVPDVYPSEADMVAALSGRMPADSVVVNSLYHTAKIAKDIARKNPGVTPLYYVQDDERMFVSEHGEPYADPDSVTGCWASFEHRLANSPWVAGVLDDLGLEPDGVITPGVDTFVFAPAPLMEKALPGDPPVVMAHCRPSTPRRGWDFIKNVVELAASEESFIFLTYDQEPPEPVAANHVHLGRIAPHRVAAEMAKVDVFFEGSVFQGFGMQALEAMASGLALLSTSNRGVDAYGTPMHDCVMVPYGNVQLASKMLVKILRSEAERYLLGSRARVAAQKFDWSKVVDAWMAYLTDLLGWERGER
jgi:glycosyltransferase involved in cell wall biosynthesis